MLTGDNETRVVSYAAEAGLFQQAGLPTVICGPGSIEQAHQPDEWIDRSQIEEGAAFMRRLVQRLSA
jgi:acetylornithine deacetylase